MTKHATRQELNKLQNLLYDEVPIEDIEYGLNELFTLLQKGNNALKGDSYDYKPNRRGDVWTASDGGDIKGTLGFILLNHAWNKDVLQDLLGGLVDYEYANFITKWRPYESTEMSMSYKDEARKLINRVVEGDDAEDVAEDSMPTIVEKKPKKRVDPKRSKAAKKAAKKMGKAARSKAAKKASKSMGPGGRKKAAKKASKTRKRYGESFYKDLNTARHASPEGIEEFLSIYPEMVEHKYIFDLDDADWGAVILDFVITEADVKCPKCGSTKLTEKDGQYTCDECGKTFKKQ